MPNVRIAWYSKAERDVYHLCQNCHYNDDIRRRHLVVGAEEEIAIALRCENPDENEEDLLCARCAELLDDGYGIILLLRVG